MTDSAPQKTPAEPVIRVRYRIRFGKVGLLQWISHRDLARLWERIVRRAFLKPSMTEGFHPKPRISFASALALGVESDDEVVELDLAETISPVDLMKRLVDDGQPGLVIHSVAMLPESIGKAKLERLDYRITWTQSSQHESWESDASEPLTVASIEEGIARVHATDSVTLQRKKKSVTLNIHEQVHSLSRDGECISLSLSPSDGATLRPEDVLALMGLADFRERGGRIRRTAVVLANEFYSDDSDLMVATSAHSPETTLGVH